MKADFWRALDDRDDTAVRQLATGDFVAIDAFAPHVWTGPGATDRWLTDLWAYCDALGVTLCQTTLREPSRVNIAGDSAYLVVPAMMASAIAGDLVAQSGVTTATLRREPDGWRITGLCWAAQ